ncbi:hypothetical protein BJY52DRAFT_1209586 [Lactarius psammicola]|nr:hypothetical protein BJY52DRAFT_1209586 [Lactarius psammicola]
MDQIHEFTNEGPEPTTPPNHFIFPAPLFFLRLLPPHIPSPATSPYTMTTLKPDAFEEIFLKLEEESERRAIMMQAEEARVSSRTPDLAAASQRAGQRRQRYRGSISISRFGHIEDYTQQASSSSTPQTPTAFVDGMTTFAPFYHSQSYNDSADSLSSESSLDDDAAFRAESEHVTQVHRIAGRLSLPRSVGGMLQRTLSRPNCLSPRAADTNVVIGVVVEENHVEELEPREATPRPASRAKAGDEGFDGELEEQSARSLQAENTSAGQQLMDSNTNTAVVM